MRSGEEVLKDIRKENCPELKKSREDGEGLLKSYASPLGQVIDHGKKKVFGMLCDENR